MTSRDNSRVTELELTRLVPAPRALVWKVWTTPEHLVRWWSPKPVVTEECEMDLRHGGIFRTHMRGPQGEEYPKLGVFLDIVPMERLVWTDALLPGWRPAPEPFMTAIITMADEGGGTRYTARCLHKNAQDRAAHEAMGFHQGWGTAYDQMAALIAEIQAS